MENKFVKIKNEWVKQAKYDIITADVMFKGGRYIYAVFMCHLSIEKYLKGEYVIYNEKYAPKTHDIIYLLSKIDIEFPNNKRDFIDELNDVSILTRYPSDLMKMINEYDKNKTKSIMKKTKEVIEWINNNSIK